jgi:hypothetical protein
VLVMRVVQTSSRQYSILHKLRNVITFLGLSDSLLLSHICNIYDCC